MSYSAPWKERVRPLLNAPRLVELPGTEQAMAENVRARLICLKRATYALRPRLAWPRPGRARSAMSRLARSRL